MYSKNKQIFLNEGGKRMEKIINVAQCIFDEYKKQTGEKIDQMKLHKLLYFAQRESFAISNKPLFEGVFEGWKYGPVSTEVRGSFSKSGIRGASGIVSDECKYIINNVIFKYGSLASWKLSELSHEEKSWLNSRKGLKEEENGNCEIKLEDIQLDAQKVRPYDCGGNISYDEVEEEIWDSTCGVSDDELTLRFERAVYMENEKKRSKGVPIAKYDIERKEAYLEYPDGRRKYASE